jgi:prepilin-type N-terminal cleavage/methylation domain-containing protein
MFYKEKKMENKKVNVSRFLFHVSRSGFTFIEVMIVIAIMGIMAVVALVSLNPAEENAAVESATRQVTSTIQLARSYALQGKRENGSAVCGFGVEITSSSQYNLYYNILQASSSDCVTQGTPGSTIGAIDSTYALPSGITFNTSSKYIYFSVPSADVTSPWTGGVCLNYSGSCQKNITVDSRGVVKVN